jgi:hypothetical protein
MEPRFGHNFAAVRVHDDREARRAARAVGAAAFTIGEHMVIGDDGGDREAMLAHELAHVVQQRQFGGAAHPREISSPHDQDEREADLAAAHVVAGLHAPPIGAAPAMLQRTVNATPHSRVRPGATACLVHVHANEGSAIASLRRVE